MFRHRSGNLLMESTDDDLEKGVFFKTAMCRVHLRFQGVHFGIAVKQMFQKIPIYPFDGENGFVN